MIYNNSLIGIHYLFQLFIDHCLIINNRLMYFEWFNLPNAALNLTIFQDPYGKLQPNLGQMLNRYSADGKLNIAKTFPYDIIYFIKHIQYSYIYYCT